MSGQQGVPDTTNDGMAWSRLFVTDVCACTYAARHCVSQVVQPVRSFLTELWECVITIDRA
jgi:hypothetical protein